MDKNNENNANKNYNNNNYYYDTRFTQLQNILSKYVFLYEKYVERELLDPESKNGATFTNRDATA